jgi:hypothetical protein
LGQSCRLPFSSKNLTEFSEGIVSIPAWALEIEDLGGVADQGKAMDAKMYNCAANEELIN